MFKYYISALEGGGGLTENADAADASRGVLSPKIYIHKAPFSMSVTVSALFET